MRSALKTLVLTIIILAVLDVIVAVMLTGPVPGALKRFFDYGLSVQGKIEQWKEKPDLPGNLLKVSWLPDMLDASRVGFAAEDPDAGPVVRNYGMSFSNDITLAAQRIDPTLKVDGMGGPGAPPNLTFAAFLKDRDNRREGDVVLLAVLSSSVAPMASFSNRTWVFEQPAPLTYPVYRLENGKLVSEEPVVQSLADEMRLAEDSSLKVAWTQQLQTRDELYTRAAFAAPWLDVSPFARLLRRASAVRAVNAAEASVIEGGGYPYADVLPALLSEFARIAREDEQVPIVLLIQSRDPADPDLRALLADDLQAQGISYLATADWQDPRNLRAFLPDGHYKEPANNRFGAVLLELISASRP